MSLDKLMSRLSGPMLMEPTRMASVLMAGQYASQEQVDKLAAKRLPRVNGQIAVIPVHGTLATFDDPWFGISSMPRIGYALDVAMSSKDIKGVILHVDSPGGTVYGTPELANKISGYRGTKPLIAIADTEAASAAYWTASAADQLVVTTSGEVGSIGVLTIHQDLSQAMEQMGRKVEIISAGKYKVEGHPFAPLDKEARAEMQRSVDEIYGDFVKAVANHRNVTPDTVRKQFGEGRMVDAKRAVSVGMADRVATFNELLSMIRAEHGGSSRADRELSAELAGEVSSFADDEEARQRDLDELELARAMGECA